MKLSKKLTDILRMMADNENVTVSNKTIEDLRAEIEALEKAADTLYHETEQWFGPLPLIPSRRDGSKFESLQDAHLRRIGEALEAYRDSRWQGKNMSDDQPEALKSAHG